MSQPLASRILATLARHPLRSAHLAQLLWLSPQQANQRLHQLASSGQVMRLPDGRWSVVAVASCRPGVLRRVM